MRTTPGALGGAPRDRQRILIAYIRSVSIALLWAPRAPARECGAASCGGGYFYSHIGSSARQGSARSDPRGCMVHLRCAQLYYVL